MVQAPSVASGLSPFHSTHEVRLEGFIAEARGTCQSSKVVDVSQCVSRASGPPPTQPMQASSASVGAKSKHPFLKLQRYDGSESLETFLLKFQHLAAYLQWNEEDRFHHSYASLDGPAGQVLWELPPHATTADLEHLPQTRFGTQLQAKSFKAKLRTRHRDKGESLQDLYRDISRLIHLAYPGVDNVLVTHVGIESFTAALNNPTLEYEVLKRELLSVEAAANYAIKLEAYLHSLSAYATVSAERGGRQAQSRSRSVFAVTDEEDDSADGTATLLKCIEQLEKQLACAAQGNHGARGSSSRKASSNKEAGACHAAGRGKPVSADGEATRNGPETRPPPLPCLWGTRPLAPGLSKAQGKG